MFNNFFIACLTGQISFLDLHKLILNRQGCFIIQQCLFTITSYLFSNKLREFNVHMCPQIHLRGTRENNAFFNLPAEMWENAPLLKRSEVPARHAKGHETYPLPHQKKSRNLFQVTQVSPLPPPRDIFEKESMWQFYTLCDIRFCQSINKRTKENVNHYNNQSQLKIHGYFWHNAMTRVCDSGTECRNEKLI